MSLSFDMDRAVAESRAAIARMTDEDRARAAHQVAALNRESEYQAELAAAGSDTLAQYWAGSASACVLRDYRAGRFVTIEVA